MAWTHNPLNIGDSTQAWKMLGELWEAVRQKYRAFGTFHWPRTNAVWESSDSFSLSTNGDGTHILMDSSKDWTVVDAPGCSHSGTRWFNFSRTCDGVELTYIPRYYDIVFDHDDPYKVVRAQILENDMSTLKLSPMAQFVTEGAISSLSSLTSRKYYIIKRDGIWWNERWPELPNANELWRGTVASATTASLTELNDQYTNKNTWEPQRQVSWKPNQFAGKQLMVFGDDGKLHRVSVTSNTTDTLAFATQSWTPTGSYAIIDTGGAWKPNHEAANIFRWYRGALKNYWSHFPNNTLLGVGIPQDTITWQEGTPPDCADVSHNAFDIDVWSALDEECSEADKCYSRHLFKTLRALQNEIVAICQSFVEAKSYTGETSIPNLTPARLFHLCSINSGTSSVTGTRNTQSTPEDTDDVLEGAKIAVPSQYEGVSIFYTVVGADGDNLASGISTVSGGYISLGDVNWKAFNGRSVIYSAGFTRYYPFEFRYLYPKTVYIPDYETKADGLGIPALVVYDPPEVGDFCHDHEEEPPVTCPEDCFGVGEDYGWVTRGKSESYVVRNVFGVLQDSGETFQTGDVARYIGDNVSDPFAGIFDQIEGTAPNRPGGKSPDLKYWDRFYRGQLPPTHQNARDVARSGFATSGSTKHLTDTERNWWNDWYEGFGVMRTESGTATGGSSTTLVDTAKTPTAFGGENPAACFWKLVRQLGNIGYKNFILEVDKSAPSSSSSGGSGIITYKTPITSVNPTTGTITFVAVSGLTVQSGDTYRIHEPPELNRWQAREVKLLFDDGATETAVITHSDKDTLWFSSALSRPVTALTRYEIVEEPFGTVWIYDGTKWVKPTGDDPRGQPWRDDQRFNMAHKRKAYGSFMAGDFVTRELLYEIYQTLNKLRHMKLAAGWTSRQDSEVYEPNIWGLLDQGNPIGCGTMDSFSPQTGDTSDPANYCLYTSSDNEEQWASVVSCYNNPDIYGILQPVPEWGYYPEANGSPPQLWGGGRLGHDAACNAQQHYAYGFIDGYPRLLTSAKDFYAMGWINASNPDPFSGQELCDESTDPYGNLTTDCWYQASDPWNQDYKVYYTKWFKMLTFDASGTPLTFRTFCKYDTTTSMDERVISAKLGENTNVPPAEMPHHYKYCVENNTFPTQTGQVRMEKGRIDFGYYAAHNTCILRFDVPGGMTLLD